MQDKQALEDSFGAAPSCAACPARESIWRDLGESELDVLARSRRLCVYEPGEVLFYQGNPCSGLHCLESGAVAMRKSHDHGPGPILRISHPPDILGLRDLAADKGYSATAQAVIPCRLCFVDQAVVRELLDNNPSCSWSFLKRMAQELNQSEDALLTWRPLSVRARLANVLLGLKDRFGQADATGRITVDLPLSRSDLAWMVGTRPETLSRATRALEEDAVASFDRRTVVIPDLDRLLDEIEKGERER